MRLGVIEMEDIIIKLKAAKVDKQKKWLFNFAASVIKAHNEGKDYGFLNRKINVYYKQHYENYFSEKYQSLSKEKKDEYKQKNLSRLSNRVYHRNLERKYRKLFKLYQEGKFSKKSTVEFDKALHEVDIDL